MSFVFIKYAFINIKLYEPTKYDFLTYYDKLYTFKHLKRRFYRWVSYVFYFLLHISLVAYKHP